MYDDDALEAIIREYYRARDIYGPMKSAHEGYAILLEEMDELWTLIKTKGIEPEAYEEEAVQIGAMALRFLIDVCRRHSEDEV
jgi:hypothetical protein